ncbi:hypothetical protein [Persicitalea sp.]|uniref:hypothetical protein n=1 Tax=Persicitalea sp. TaxID=3100273 RepID=UPI003593B867
MKKTIFTAAFLLATLFASAQDAKQPVYGEFGLGFGQTLFLGDTKTLLNDALGGMFDPGITSNLMMAFYYAPQKWKGLGVGSRIKGSIATSVTGDFGDSYFFNYYNLSASAKYYVSREFNRGLYGRAGVGFGQLTTKRANETTNAYVHQFAVGTTLTGSIGYSLPVRRGALSLEAEYEGSSRNGTIDRLGDQMLRSGQVALNLIYSF